MHGHKAVARIFLILSIVNFTSVGLAQTLTMHEVRVDLVTGVEDVAGVSGTGHTQSELPEPLVGSQPMAGHTQSEELPQSLASQPTAEHTKSEEWPESFASQSTAGHTQSEESPESLASQSTTGHTQSEEFPESLASQSTAEHTQYEELPESPGSQPTAWHSRVDEIPITPAPSPGIAVEDPENDKFFSPEMIRRMKEYLVLGAVYGVFVGISNSVQKEIMGNVAPNAYVIFFSHLTSLPSPANT